MERAMARPPKATGTATTETLTTKVTKAERRLLEALLARKNRIALMQGHGAITISFYIRGLIVRDLAVEKEREAAGVTTVSTQRQIDTTSRSLDEADDDEAQAEAQSRALGEADRSERRKADLAESEARRVEGTTRSAKRRKGLADHMREITEGTGGTWGGPSPERPSKGGGS
jgi:hypothetical protein